MVVLSCLQGCLEDLEVGHSVVFIDTDLFENQGEIVEINESQASLLVRTASEQHKRLPVWILKRNNMLGTKNHSVT